MLRLLCLTLLVATLVAGRSVQQQRYDYLGRVSSVVTDNDDHFTFRQDDSDNNARPGREDDSSNRQEAGSWGHWWAPYRGGGRGRVDDPSNRQEAGSRGDMYKSHIVICPCNEDIDCEALCI